MSGEFEGQETPVEKARRIRAEKIAALRALLGL